MSRYDKTKEKCEPQEVLEKNDSYSEVVMEISTGPKRSEEHWSNIKQGPYSLQLPVKVSKRIRKQAQHEKSNLRERNDNVKSAYS